MRNSINLHPWKHAAQYKMEDITIVNRILFGGKKWVQYIRFLYPVLILDYIYISKYNCPSKKNHNIFSLRLSSTCYCIHTYFYHNKSSYFNLVISTAPRQPQFMHRTLTPLSLTHLTAVATNWIKCESRHKIVPRAALLDLFPSECHGAEPQLSLLEEKT